jgi:hypothetical protein
MAGKATFNVFRIHGDSAEKSGKPINAEVSDGVLTRDGSPVMTSEVFEGVDPTPLKVAGSAEFIVVASNVEAAAILYQRKRGHTKWNDAQVMEMRQRYADGDSLKTLAEAYGGSPVGVRNAVVGNTHKTLAFAPGTSPSEVKSKREAVKAAEKARKAAAAAEAAKDLAEKAQAQI